MIDTELEKYWKTVVDTIQDGIIIVDPSGKIFSANKAFESMSGQRISDVIGKSCTIINCEGCHVTLEKNTPYWCKLFREGDLNNHKSTMTRKDGRLVHILKNASLLRDDRGEVIGAVESLTDITELMEKDTQIKAFRHELYDRDSFHGMIGTSAPMERVFELITNASKSDAPIIILGESGTGKELAAKAVHELSDRREAPYIKVNCAALNESLLESELFGHTKGAFTGALKNHEGRFEAARAGDIFLDEIGDLPLSTQVKLLRVLEEKVIERVGDNQPIDIDIRIISATNQDLPLLVKNGIFREDLFYRINVIPITIPPLRDRVEDIPLLADSFFRKIQLKSNKNIRGISNKAMDLLVQYPWPGNVRELKSAFEFAFVTCQNDTIQPMDFPLSLLNTKRLIPEQETVTTETGISKKQQLIDALQRTRGHQSKAAELLGVSRVTVWNRMKRYGLKIN
jgi:two-component system, NtrC family, response regulator HydG